MVKVDKGSVCDEHDVFGDARLSNIKLGCLFAALVCLVLILVLMIVSISSIHKTQIPLQLLASTGVLLLLFVCGFCNVGRLRSAVKPVRVLAWIAVLVGVVAAMFGLLAVWKVIPCSGEFAILEPGYDIIDPYDGVIYSSTADTIDCAVGFVTDAILLASAGLAVVATIGGYLAMLKISASKRRKSE